MTQKKASSQRKVIGCGYLLELELQVMSNPCDEPLNKKPINVIIFKRFVKAHLYNLNMWHTEEKII